MSKALRPCSDIDYSSESRNESVFTIESASKWRKGTSQYMKIRVTDVHEIFPKEGSDILDDAKPLVISEWINGEWLKNVNVRTSHYSNKIKTLIGKIRKVYLSEEESITEVIVDGFMESLLHILCFDDYPCFLYPQYDYLAKIGPNSRSVKSKPDFSGAKTKTTSTGWHNRSSCNSALWPLACTSGRPWCRNLCIHYFISQALKC
jgi:hypothetical protein